MNMQNLAAGTMLGAAVGGTRLLADAVTTQHIDVRDAAAVAVFVGTLVWWMSRKFAKIEDKLDEHAERISNLPCKEVEVVVKKVVKKLKCGDEL